MAKTKKYNEKEILEWILAIFIIVFIIATLGAFTNSKNLKVQPQELDKKKELNKKIKDLDAQIAQHAKTKERDLKRQKLIFIGVRLLIAAILVALNLIWLSWQNWSFDLGDQLNINAAILTLYSFVGFVAYGSLNSFTTAIKRKSIQVLRKRNVHIYAEMPALQEEKKQLEIQLKEIELPKGINSELSIHLNQ